MNKNIVSDNLKEYVLGIAQASKEGYIIVEETVDYHAGYFKVLMKKEEISSEGEIIHTVLEWTTAVEMLDNPAEPNEKLKEILELDKPKPKRRK